MDEVEAASAPSIRVRMGDLLDRVEAIYLRVLRITILVIATLLILYTLYLGVTGLYRVSRSEASVTEAVATVVANEIVDAEAAALDPLASPGKPVPNAEQQKYYAGLVTRYYTLFRQRFEPFRQPEDKSLTRDEFDDNFVRSGDRLQAVTEGRLSFAEDKADLEAMLATMTAAAADPKVAQRLKRYKAAKKVAVQRETRKTRTEYRNGWNSYSTSCYEWYLSPIGCPERRSVQVPYTEKVTVMEFPKGTQSHAQIFRAMQDRYYSLLDERRRSNAASAEFEREEIVAGNYRGRDDLGWALQIFAGFIALMFFFLLIAIERHQRRLSEALPGEADPVEPAPSAQSPRPRARRASPAR